MAHIRTDTLDHLVEDLQRDNPRLILIFGENHGCLEGRELFTRVARKANVAFFERPNASGDPTGHHMNPHDLRTRLESMLSMPDPAPSVKREVQEIRMMLAPQNAVLVDQQTPEAKRMWLATKAMDRLHDDRVPHTDPLFRAVDIVHDAAWRNRIPQAAVRMALPKAAMKRLHADGAPPNDPLMQAVHNIDFERMGERLRHSNRAMGAAAAAYMDRHHRHDERVLGMMLVGRTHNRDLEYHGLLHTDSDLQEVLSRKGYKVVRIELSPEQRLDETQKPGDHRIRHPGPTSRGADYIVEVIDPEAVAGMRHNDDVEQMLRHARNKPRPPSGGRHA